MKKKKTKKKITRKKITKKNKNICVISLTHNRSEYIQRAFESLYKRAGTKFDHFVFDDGSNKETVKLLKELKKQYNFNLFLNKQKEDIFKRFYLSILHIPVIYDYYVKLDSDTEILSDNFFNEILEVFSCKETHVCGVIPRVEGIRNADRYDAPIQFFAGHAVKFEAPIVSGCCMVFSNAVFASFPRLTEKQIYKIDQKWGIDSILYDYSRKLGKFLIVEDLSVYHIDNAYGQRRVNMEYFTERQRWGKIDNDEVWFMKTSKEIYPKYINKDEYLKIKSISGDYNEFLNNCKKFLKDKQPIIKKMITERKIEIKEEYKKEQECHIEKMFKVSSPLNFRPDENIQHGTFKLYSELPLWAKNNPRVVIEIEEIKIKE